MARVGLMLYTVREECARDFEGTLHAVAGLGYEGVELFDLHGADPARVRGWLDECGLGVAARHISLEAAETQLPGLAAEADVLGTPRVVVGWIAPPATAGEAQVACERIARAARDAASVGLELGFHNHDAEVRPLDDGRSFLDRLLEVPVFLELDLGWVWWAGVDPVELLERTHGRVPLVHVKDLRSRGKREFCPVGEGSVGYERVGPAAAARGAEWLLVEQDETEGPALEAAARALVALSEMLVTA